MPTHVKRTAEDKIDHVGPAAKKQKIDTKVHNRGCVDMCSIGSVEPMEFQRRVPDSWLMDFEQNSGHARDSNLGVQIV